MLAPAPISCSELVLRNGGIPGLHFYTELLKNFESLDSFLAAVRDIAPSVTEQAIGDLSPRTVLGFRQAWKRERSYHEFAIPKKSGGERRITAPTGTLKDIQTCIARLLVKEYVPHPCAMGFAPGRSVATNAALHVGRKYVFNTDLKDFFPSIGAPKVEGALAASGVEPMTARLISTLCCIPVRSGDGRILNILPQGSPASPILSNIACEMMDRRLEGLARRFGLSYSRYADDITFSSDHQCYTEGDGFYAPDGEFMRELVAIASDNGFRLNAAKTRLARNGDRKEVTGLSVDRKVNVTRDYVKNLRAALFQMEHRIPTGREVEQGRGRLAYMRMVKGKDDPTYMKLEGRFKRIIFKYKAYLKKCPYSAIIDSEK